MCSHVLGQSRPWGFALFSPKILGWPNIQGIKPIFYAIKIKTQLSENWTIEWTPWPWPNSYNFVCTQLRHYLFLLGCMFLAEIYSTRYILDTVIPHRKWKTGRIELQVFTVLGKGTTSGVGLLSRFGNSRNPSLFAFCETSLICPSNLTTHIIRLTLNTEFDTLQLVKVNNLVGGTD